MKIALLLLASLLDQRLDEVARIASVMVDGEECKRIPKKEVIHEMFHPDPRDKWSAADNYAVNHEPYIRVKKTLIRLSRLVNFPCDVNLWMPLPQDNKIHVVIRNSNEMSQFSPWGDRELFEGATPRAGYPVRRLSRRRSNPLQTLHRR